MKMKKNKIYLYYSMIFLVAFPLAFYVFLRDEKSFVWRRDAIPLYVSNLKYIGRMIRQSIQCLFYTGKIEIPMYDFNIGFGIDIITFLRYEPLNFLSIFVKARYTEYLYNVLVIIRIYLIGFSFLVYCNYQKWDNYASLCGSLVYTFSGYTLWAGIRHPEFLMPLIILPIACMNIYKLIHGEKAKYFSTLIAISFLSSWYLTYIYTIILGIWFLVSYFFRKKEERILGFWEITFKIIKNYFCGFTYLAIILFPAIMVYLKSNRTGSGMNWKELLSYGNGWGEKLIPYIFSQTASPGYWIRINALIIAFFCIIILFLKTKETKWKVQLIVFTLCLFIPAFGFITSGFSVINNRWSYAYSFILACIVAITLPKIKELTSRDKIVSFVILLLYIGLIFKSGDYHNKWLSYEIIMLLFTYIVILLIDIRIGINWFYKVGCMILILFNIALNGYIRYDKKYENYVSAFADKGQAMDLILESNAKIVKNIQDKDFYRIEYGETNYQSGNWGMYLYRNPTSITYSQLSQYMEKFLFDNEISKYSIKVAFAGLDGRNALLQLFSTRYYVQNENALIIPANYKKSLSSEGECVYKGQNVLPLAFTYDKYMTEEQYYSLDSVDRQYAMLNSVLIHEKNMKLEKSKLDFRKANQLKINNVVYKDLKWEVGKGEIISNSQNSSISISIPTVSKKAEYYVKLIGTNVDRVTSETINWKIKFHGQQKSIELRNSNDTYSTGMDNVLVYMGTWEEDEINCEIIFPKKGIYGLKDIEIYARPIDDLESLIEERKEEALENIEVGVNQINGEITVSENKFLCFSIPYSTGWTCYIDGEKVDLQRANTMLMGVMLEKGTHKIQLNYVTPGLKAGLCVTISSFLVLGLKIWRSKKKTKDDIEI